MPEIWVGGGIIAIAAGQRENSASLSSSTAFHPTHTRGVEKERGEGAAAICECGTFHLLVNRTRRDFSC